MEQKFSLIEFENDLVQRAMSGREGYEELVEYLRPQADEYTKKFFIHFGDDEGLEYDKVWQSSWELLWWALEKHKQRIGDVKKGITEPVLFSAYFAWCIRKGQDNYRNKELGIEEETGDNEK